MLTALVNLVNAHACYADLPWATAQNAILAGFGAPALGERFVSRHVERSADWAVSPGSTWRVMRLGSAAARVSTATCSSSLNRASAARPGRSGPTTCWCRIGPGRPSSRRSDPLTVAAPASEDAGQLDPVDADPEPLVEGLIAWILRYISGVGMTAIGADDPDPFLLSMANAIVVLTHATDIEQDVGLALRAGQASPGNNRGGKCLLLADYDARRRTRRRRSGGRCSSFIGGSKRNGIAAAYRAAGAKGGSLRPLRWADCDPGASAAFAPSARTRPREGVSEDEAQRRDPMHITLIPSHDPAPPRPWLPQWDGGFDYETAHGERWRISEAAPCARSTGHPAAAPRQP